MERIVSARLSQPSFRAASTLRALREAAEDRASVTGLLAVHRAGTVLGGAVTSSILQLCAAETTACQLPLGCLRQQGKLACS